MRSRSRSRTQSSRVVIGLASIALSGSAWALECPVRQADNPIGVDQASAKVAEILKTSSGLALTNNMPTVVNLLRSSYPKLEPAQVVNHLIAAYCPILNARQDIADPEKTTILEGFAAAATRAAF
jgi:hypothetical protein